MKWPGVIRKLHKWIGLIIGLQLLAWVLGGLVMTSLPIERVRGEHLRAAAPDVDWQQASYSPQQILQLYPGARLIKLSHRLGEPAYVLQHNQTEMLVSASSGRAYSPLASAQAIALAQAAFIGTAAQPEANYLTEAPIEYRNKALPAWQVRMQDDENTHVYLDAQTGEVTAMRTGTWRVFDFFWMLHVMDYSTRDDFNHPLVISAAAIALTAILSGFFMLYFVMRRRRHASTPVP